MYFCFILFSIYSYTAFHTQQNVCGIKKRTLILFIQQGCIKIIKSFEVFLLQQICILESFLKDHVTLNTDALITGINYFLKIYSHRFVIK